MKNKKQSKMQNQTKEKKKDKKGKLADLDTLRIMQLSLDELETTFYKQNHKSLVPLGDCLLVAFWISSNAYDAKFC